MKKFLAICFLCKFFCELAKHIIAGYTSGGTPYGVTWEEMGMKPWEDLEENE